MEKKWLLCWDVRQLELQVIASVSWLVRASDSHIAQSRALRQNSHVSRTLMNSLVLILLLRAFTAYSVLLAVVVVGAGYKPDGDTSYYSRAQHLIDFTESNHVYHVDLHARGSRDKAPWLAGFLRKELGSTAAATVSHPIRRMLSHLRAEGVELEEAMTWGSGEGAYDTMPWADFVLCVPPVDTCFWTRWFEGVDRVDSALCLRPRCHGKYCWTTDCSTGSCRLCLCLSILLSHRMFVCVYLNGDPRAQPLWAIPMGRAQPFVMGGNLELMSA